jgi:L-amino acid N-acyltransferase YncA
MGMMLIRPALPADGPAIWALIGPVLAAGETYALDPDISQADALAYWLGPDRKTFVAEDAGRVVGTYYLRPNQAGGGNHVCNCGYISAATGVGRKMAEHSLDQARAQGYRAMQFNLVVATNRRAIGLWQSLGFETVGTLPGAFRHPAQGYVDALVMYRAL